MPRRVEAEIVVKLRDEISNRLKEIENRLEGLKRIGGVLQNVGLQMMGIGTTIGTGLGMAVKTFTDFEYAMKNVQAVAGATQEEFKLLSKTAREYAKNSIFTAKEAADAMYYLASAGMKTREIVDSLNGVLNLATATQSDLAQSSMVITSTLAQFGLKAEEAGRVADVFTAAISNSQATLTKLQYSMRYIGPVAKSLGMSLEETTAALMALYDAGYRGEQAGTILRNALARLLDPTREMLDILRKHNVQFAKNADKLYELATKIDELKEKYMELQEAGVEKDSLIVLANQIKRLKEELKKAAVEGLLPFNEILKNLQNAGLSTGEIMAMFGLRAGPGVASLISQGAEKVIEYTKILENVHGTASKIAEMQKDTLYGSFKILLSVIQEAAIALGEALAPTIKDVADKIRGLVEWFNNLPAPVKEAIAKFTAFSSVALTLGGGLTFLVGTLMKAVVTWKQFATIISTSIPFLKNLPSIIGGLSPAFSQIFTGLVAGAKGFISTLTTIFSAMGPWGLIIAAIVALVPVIIKNWDKIKAFFVKLWEGIKNFFIRIWEGMKAYYKAWIETYKRAWEKVKNFFISIWNTIVNSWKKVIEGFKKFFIKIWESIKGFFSKIWYGMKKIVEIAVNGMLTPINWVIKGLNKILALVNKILGTNWQLKELKVDFTSEDNEEVVKQAKEIADQAEETAEVINKMNERMKVFRTTIRNTAGEMRKSMLNVVEKTKEIFGKLSLAPMGITGVVKPLKDTGRVVEETGKKFENVITAVQKVSENFGNVAKISDVSSEAMDEIGKRVEKLSSSLDTAINKLTNLVDKLKGIQSIEVSIKGLGESVGTLVEAFREFATIPIALPAEGLIEWLPDIREAEKTKRFVDFIRSAFDVLVDTISRLGEVGKREGANTLRAVADVLNELNDVMKNITANQPKIMITGPGEIEMGDVEEAVKKLDKALGKVKDTINQVRKAVNDLIDKFGKIVSVLEENMVNIEKAFDELKDKFDLLKTMLDEITESFRNMIDTISSEVSALSSKTVDEFKKILDVISEIESKLGTVFSGKPVRVEVHYYHHVDVRSTGGIEVGNLAEQIAKAVSG